MGVGSIHGRRDVATHQRRPFVNRTRGCKDISSSKASRGRVVSGRSYSFLSIMYERASLRASLSARNYMFARQLLNRMGSSQKRHHKKMSTGPAAGEEGYEGASASSWRAGTIGLL